MYDDIFYKQVQISRSDIRPHIKWAASLVILHMVTSIFLQGLCGYIWVNILTLPPRRGSPPAFVQTSGQSHCRKHTCKHLFNPLWRICEQLIITRRRKKNHFVKQRHCKRTCYQPVVISRWMTQVCFSYANHI